MAVTSAFWNFIDGGFEGYDVHVLKGQTSRTLNDLLKIKDGVEPNATFKLASEDGGHPFGTTTRFFGEFDGAPGPAHGVERVDERDAVVVAAAELLVAADEERPDDVVRQRCERVPHDRRIVLAVDEHDRTSLHCDRTSSSIRAVYFSYVFVSVENWMMRSCPWKG